MENLKKLIESILIDESIIFEKKELTFYNNSISIELEINPNTLIIKENNFKFYSICNQKKLIWCDITIKKTSDNKIYFGDQILWKILKNFEIDYILIMSNSILNEIIIDDSLLFKFKFLDIYNNFPSLRTIKIPVLEISNYIINLKKNIHNEFIIINSKIFSTKCLQCCLNNLIINTKLIVIEHITCKLCDKSKINYNKICKILKLVKKNYPLIEYIECRRPKKINNLIYKKLFQNIQSKEDYNYQKRLYIDYKNSKILDQSTKIIKNANY